ncbi:hypothetical protein [Micromonospora cathayae]|uniref:Uncharacterized protein n=1 Tax=Micromonospora cathayae TaxID=3028804 RepID=A0ABY7ZKA1_9ACTN|nr:hypothetical protein [Micromonospora sp. HUAS 3]WDZ83422.1 hypothetical protein PVK37_23590 [Micromonospora sp. HUAS 3]
MPVLRRLGGSTGPVAPGDAAGPALERIVGFTFAPDPGPAPTAEERKPFVDHMESLYGPLDDLSWLTEGARVSYHDMVRTVVDDLGPALTDVDLVVTVDATPDCRHQSFPGALLTELLPGDPLMMGVTEQGVAGPFTALRIAHQQLRAGQARRALILVMEQSTLPPGGTRPAHDVAVALLLGPDGTVAVDAPTLVVTRTGPGPADLSTAARPGADLPTEDRAGADLPEVDLIVAGAGPESVPAGVPVRHAPTGHPCAGVWLALADLLADPHRPAGRVLVTDRDPVLPYRCAVTLTLPADRPETPAQHTVGRGRPVTVRADHGHPAGPAGPPGAADGAARPRRTRELVR